MLRLVRGVDYEAGLLDKFLDTLKRENPVLYKSYFAIYCEGNHSWNRVEDIWLRLLHRKDVIPVRSVAGERSPGIWTQEVDKEVGVQLMNDLMKQNMMFLGEKFFTHANTGKEGATSIMKTQLTCLEVRIYHNKDKKGIAKREISGKAYGPDDVAIGTILLIKWAYLFEARPDLGPKLVPGFIARQHATNFMAAKLDADLRSYMEASHLRTNYNLR